MDINELENSYLTIELVIECLMNQGYFCTVRGLLLHCHDAVPLKVCRVTCSDNVGELINNTAILEHNTATKSTCATFRNMVCTLASVHQPRLNYFTALFTNQDFFFGSTVHQEDQES